MPHIGDEVWHILAEILPLLHPFRYPAGRKVMPQDIRGAVSWAFWVSSQLPAFMEERFNIIGTVLPPVMVWKEYRCVRVKAAGNGVVFPAHVHDRVLDRDASVLVPFRVCNIDCIMQKIKILPCEMADFLRPHSRRILEAEKKSQCVCQQRAPLVIWVIVSRLKKRRHSSSPIICGMRRLS